MTGGQMPRRTLLGQSRRVAAAAIATMALAGEAAAADGALTLIIIRHGEKPKEIWPGPGLTPDGAPDAKSLVVRGWQRAGSWAALFGSGLGGADYPTPAAIYTGNTKISGEGISERPHETIIPLAARLGLTPNLTYRVGEEPALVAEITRLAGVVLVCWEHKMIGKAMLPALLGGQQIADVPREWDSDRYDVVLRFDREAPGKPWRFRQLFPRLLSGNSATPMA